MARTQISESALVTRTSIADLQVADILHAFVRDEALPGSGIAEVDFWAGVAAIFADFAPRNRELLARRDALQAQLDEYHRGNSGVPSDVTSYISMLQRIGYLVDEPPDFTIATTGVDDEVAMVAGPQLVVPISNARFAVNAANARWGSLYDCLYGTDAVRDDNGMERATSYNATRGAEVVRRSKLFLDDSFPLTNGISHFDARQYFVGVDTVGVRTAHGTVGLADPAQYVGHIGRADDPRSDRTCAPRTARRDPIRSVEPVGASDSAGIKDVMLEAAVSTIMDLEDSVTAVDAADKVDCYRAWLQLNAGTLEVQVAKNETMFTRRLASDRTYQGAQGEVVLPGRALLFVRQVGLLMTTDAILDAQGHEVPEGVLDAIMTALGSLPDLQRRNRRRNSRSGSMYAVKPKMHGPDEVKFSVDLFQRVEDLLGLPYATIKLGIMDEERRTSANLKACIYAARDRIAFINTGFLDRTGDELHTSMQAGPMVAKGDMRDQTWLQAYEDQNVDIGLACGLSGRAQIGKGMWAMPDRMADMMEQKIAHPLAGASCAWVPSPTAATLHAIHYHQVDVAARQRTYQHVPRPASTAYSRFRWPSIRTGRPSTDAPNSRTTCKACSATSSAGSIAGSDARRCPTSTA